MVMVMSLNLTLDVRGHIHLSKCRSKRICSNLI